MYKKTDITSKITVTSYDENMKEYKEGFEDYYKEKANSNPYRNHQDTWKAQAYDKGYLDAEHEDLDDLDDINF